MTKDKLKELFKEEKSTVAQAQASAFICDFYFSSYSSKTAVGASIGSIFAYHEKGCGDCDQ